MNLVKSRGLFLIVLFLYTLFLAYFLLFDNTHYTASGFPIRDDGDGYGYAVLAKNMLSHHVFSSTTEAPYIPDTFRTPGYPIFIAFFLLIFKNLLTVSIAQILLTAGTAVLIQKIALKLNISEKWSFIAGLAYALIPTTITLSLHLLSETLFIFLLVGSVYYFYFSSTKSYLIGSIYLGLAILVRPIALYLPLLIFITLIAYRNWKKLGITMATIVIILLPWYARNANIAHTWALASVSANNLLYYNVAYFLADRENTSIEIIQTRLTQELGISNINETASLTLSKRVNNLAISYLKRYPVQYGKYHVMKTGMIFTQSPLSNFLNDASKMKKVLSQLKLVDTQNKNINQLVTRGSYLTAITVLLKQPLLLLDRLFWITMAFLMLLPFLYKQKSLPKRSWLLLLLVGYFALLSAPNPDVRLRAPLYPFMVILAIQGIQKLSVWSYKIKPK